MGGATQEWVKGTAYCSLSILYILLQIKACPAQVSELLEFEIEASYWEDLCSEQVFRSSLHLTCCPAWVLGTGICFVAPSSNILASSREL